MVIAITAASQVTLPGVAQVLATGAGAATVAEVDRREPGEVAAPVAAKAAATTIGLPGEGMPPAG